MRRLWLSFVFVVFAGSAGVVGANERADLCREMGGTGAYSVDLFGHTICYMAGGGGGPSGWVPWEPNPNPHPGGGAPAPTPTPTPTPTPAPEDILHRGDQSPLVETPVDKLEETCSAVRNTALTVAYVAAGGAAFETWRVGRVAEVGYGRLPFGTGPELINAQRAVSGMDYGDRIIDVGGKNFSLSSEGWPIRSSATPTAQAGRLATQWEIWGTWGGALGSAARIVSGIGLGVSAAFAATNLYMDLRDNVSGGDAALNVINSLYPYIPADNEILRKECLAGRMK